MKVYNIALCFMLALLLGGCATTSGEQKFAVSDACITSFNSCGNSCQNLTPPYMVVECRAKCKTNGSRCCRDNNCAQFSTNSEERELCHSNCAKGWKQMSQ